MSALEQDQGSTVNASIAAGDPSLGITKRIASHVSRLTYEDLPASLVALIKECVLDTLGVTIGATGLAPEARILAEYVRRQDAKQDCTILGFGGKSSATLAAFANGSFGHMLDYDDVCGLSCHMSITTIPVALAVAEKLGGINGKEFITAVAAGTDLMVRLELAIPIPDWRVSEGWFATQLLGFLAGAATAARLMKLNPAQVEDALGIAFTQLSGSYQMASGASSHLRSMQAGFSGQGGVLAAELASSGISGSKEILEGRYGFFSTYVRTKTPNWTALSERLGTYFPAVDHHHFKRWPACDYTRPVNLAIAQLLKKHDVAVTEIAEIFIVGGSGGTKLLCEPLDSKRRPKTSIDGKFSLPFTAATMFVHGNVRLSDYTDEGRSNALVLSIADKIFYKPSSGGAADDGVPHIELRLQDGRVFEAKATADDLRGSVDYVSLLEKFRDCTSFSACPIAEQGIDNAIQSIRNLEELKDMSTLIEQLRPSSD